MSICRCRCLHVSSFHEVRLSSHCQVISKSIILLPEGVLNIETESRKVLLQLDPEYPRLTSRFQRINIIEMGIRSQHTAPSDALAPSFAVHLSAVTNFATCKCRLSISVPLSLQRGTTGTWGTTPGSLPVAQPSL